MILFHPSTALRMGLVSLTLTAIASPSAWFVAREQAETSIVSLAMEESSRLLRHHDALQLLGPDAVAHAQSAAKTISGCLFYARKLLATKVRRHFAL